MYTHKIFKGKIFQIFVSVQSSRKYQICEFQCGTSHHDSYSSEWVPLWESTFTELKVFYTKTATLGEHLTYDSEIKVNKAKKSESLKNKKKN